MAYIPDPGGRFVAEIAGSNPAESTNVYLVFICYVVVCK
jgi:hypothetical protein